MNCCVFLGYPVDAKILSICPITFSNSSTRPVMLCRTSGNCWPDTNLSDSPFLQGLSQIPLPSTFSMFSFKDVIIWRFGFFNCMIAKLFGTAEKFFPRFSFRFQTTGSSRLIFRRGVPLFTYQVGVVPVHFTRYRTGQIPGIFVCVALDT